MNNNLESNPLISVIICVYNADNFIVDALNSIDTQTENDFELIIVDDGSTDSSLKLIEEFILNKKY
ncbi:glycosyltransferase family 2 protein, partial [Vibrio breoganii]